MNEPKFRITVVSARDGKVWREVWAHSKGEAKRKEMQLLALASRFEAFVKVDPPIR